MKDPTILTILATLGRLITDLVTGQASKRTAYEALQASAELLRDDLTTEALARGELAADIAEDLKVPR